MKSSDQNRYSLGWRASARLKHGLHWRNAAPTLADYPEAKTYAIRLLIVLACWGWAMDQDYIAEVEREAAINATKAERAEQMLLECMNGRARWIAENQKSMVACDKAWSTTL